MLELFTSGLASAWLEIAGIKSPQLDAKELLVWQGVPSVVLPTSPEPTVETTIEQYLKGLSAQKMIPENQGIWIQSGPLLAMNHKGTIPFSAASLTKIATTLAALEIWGPAHQFETLISATGPIKNGVLEGDLVIKGNGDPFFVWEEAIALGNSLNQLGIRQVTGNLVISEDFYMNYQLNPLIAGQLLKQALDNKQWQRGATNQYLNMPKGTPRPKVVIAGNVVQAGSFPFPNPRQFLLIRHKSMTLMQILKEMNIYSNNEMAEILAKSIGGEGVVAQQAAQAGGFSIEEIQLVNGSGLGVKNRISPRAACLMFMAIQRYLQPYQLTVADLFPVAGRDRRGTMVARRIPNGTVIKTGTLNEVSALAGVMPTRDRGLVWFAIINGGNDVQGFRNQQDQLLRRLLQQWGIAPELPVAITPRTETFNASKYLGASDRNQIISDLQANSSVFLRK